MAPPRRADAAEKSSLLSSDASDSSDFTDASSADETSSGEGLGRPRKTQLFGTSERSRIWCATKDKIGMLLSALVLVMLVYSDVVMIAVVLNGSFALANAFIFSSCCLMTLWCHLGTMLADPGAVPKAALPLKEEEVGGVPITMCGRCDAYKPPGAHHDRISNRCIVRMDHFCPWMNNAIGARNQKQFLVFLAWLDITATYAVGLLAYHLVDCEAFRCTEFSDNEVKAVYVLVIFCLFAVLFATSMIVNQVYGILTGMGTIDRMKIKKGQSVKAQPIPFTDVFGTGLWITHILPTPPVFDVDHEEKVMRYRLKRQVPGAYHNGASSPPSSPTSSSAPSVSPYV